jgi:DNA-binding MarR family transcriptional regulator
LAEIDTQFRFAGLLTHEERVLWRQFVETHASIVRRLDEELRAQTAGLTLSSYEVLYELVRAPGNRLRMAELADRLLFTRSGVTRLIDRLERAGFVERVECVHDGRGVYAILTQQGFDAFEVAVQPHVDGIRRVFFDRLDGGSEVFGQLLERLAPEKAAKSPAA